MRWRFGAPVHCALPDASGKSSDQDAAGARLPMLGGDEEAMGAGHLAQFDVEDTGLLQAAGAGGGGDAHLSWFSGGGRAGGDGAASQMESSSFASGPTDEIFDFL